MRILPKRLEIAPNQKGYLYRNHRLLATMAPTITLRFDPFDRLNLVVLPQAARLLVVTNQEILTKDSVALRLSIAITYRIDDGERFLGAFEPGQPTSLLLAGAELVISNLVQLELRKRVALVDSEHLNECRKDFDDLRSPEIAAELTKSGIAIEKAQIRDITFPKGIQDLFARQLESKIRSRAELENARTAVATARAFKNAADLMQGDDSARFFQYLETLNKIAAKGHHTFVVGDYPGKPCGK